MVGNEGFHMMRDTNLSVCLLDIGLTCRLIDAEELFAGLALPVLLWIAFSFLGVAVRLP